MRNSKTKWSFEPTTRTTIADVVIHGEPLTMAICAGQYDQDAQKVIRDIGRIQSYITESEEKGALVNESNDKQRAVSIVS
jgi:hypothetical protein